MSIDRTAYSGIRAVVTGASGFIGRWVARALSQAGAEVILVVRDPDAMAAVADAYEISGAIVVANLASEDEIRAVIRDARPEITFNLAGYGVDHAERDADAAHLLNTLAVGRLASAVAEYSRSGGRMQGLVHVGSALEYGPLTGLVDEAVEARPTTMYGKTKLEGTRALQRVSASKGLMGLTARLFTVYGPGEHRGRLLPSLFEASERGEPVSLSPGTNARDFTYVEDVAEGLLRLGLSDTAPGSVVNLATGTLHTVRGFAEIAAHVLGIQPDQLRFGALDMRADETEQAIVSIERLRAGLGWQPPTDIASGIHETARFRRRLPRPGAPA